MKEQRRIALIGGPGTGKTTIVENLASRGYTIIPEAARMIIEQEQWKDSDCLPWSNTYSFQQKVAKTILELESSFNSREILCDRGLLDGIVYCEDSRIAVPEIITNNRLGRYDLVLFLDALPTYRTDESRKETPEKARELHAKTVKPYLNAGYPIYRVPVIKAATIESAVAKRADYVIKLIEGRGI